MLRKALTVKAAAIAGVLVLSGGVASAATGTLPDPAQDVAHSAASVVGLDSAIPKADDDAPDTDEVESEHPENHGKDVSGVAHDDSTEGADHGSAVCTVASDGKCQPNADDDNSGPGNSADHRQDGAHRNSHSGDDDAVDDSTTTTTVDDSADDDGAEHEAGDDDGAQSGKGKGKSGGNDNSGRDHPEDD